MCLFSGLGVVGPSITIWLENYLDFANIPVSTHSVSIKVRNWVDHDLLTETKDPVQELVEAKEVEAKELVDATLAKELEVQVLVAS